MRMMKTHVLICLLGILLANRLEATSQQNPFAFMSAQDMHQSELSNIVLMNESGQALEIDGLFIPYLDVLDVTECSSCYGAVYGSENVGGTVISPTSVTSNQSIPIGKNYLYNMLYNAIYYGKALTINTPCSLPGCTWPGDDPNVHGWCISINALSRHANYTYSYYTKGSNLPANVPPYAYAGNNSGLNYKYSLINPSTLGQGNRCIGPITCDDQTLTCTASNNQQQVIQPYS